MEKGKLIILTAPSGSGKTTLAKRLMQDFTNIRFSVSATTRKPREGEVNGENYYFITRKEFQQKIADGEFLEHEEFYNGTMYGTLKTDVENQLKKGYFVLLDIEVKGAINIKSQYGENCLSVFVRPPSIKELENRLSARGTETRESLRLRLDRAEMELEFESNFDAVVVNKNLEQAYQNLKIIIEPYLKR